MDNILTIDNENLVFDGKAQEEIDYNKEDFHVTFKFNENSECFSKLKDKGFGGSLVPRCSLALTGIDYDVLAFGARTDINQEISFYLLKS